MRRPVRRLIEALYGHPEAGAHWERRLQRILIKMGGKAVPSHPSCFFFVATALLLTIYVGGQRVDAGVLDLGHVFQFVFYVNLLTWPFASVGWVTSLVQKAEASMARILDFLQAQPDVQSPVAGRSELAQSRGSLTFQNVSWTYPDTGIEAIHDLSFSIRPGETLGITGRTGSGKSTVLQLAMRIMDPKQGQILLDGTPLQDWNLATYRSHMGYVPQDVFLFSDSILNNIEFGLTSDHAPLSAPQAARLAGVSQDIEQFEHGYDTLLGERGVNLSGGQKQRISVARALIRQPRILLLDDCLSAVDHETEDANDLQSSNPL